MCMLSVFRPGVTTDGLGIWEGAMANQDGHGWAIVIPAHGSAPARIQVGHGMRADDVCDDFVAARDRYPDGPALFHSRWATHGVIDDTNCHPFTVGGDPRIVLAHNGILPQKAHPLKGDSRSDTRKFAESILPKWSVKAGGIGSGLDDRKLRKAISTWLGSNKVAVLSVHPKSQESLYLFGESLGNTSPEGVWYSNHDWIPYTRPTYKGFGDGNTGGITYAQGTDGSWYPTVIGNRESIRWDDDNELCLMCEARGQINHVMQMCTACRSCTECGGEVVFGGSNMNGDCDCYTPNSMVQSAVKELDR